MPRALLALLPIAALACREAPRPLPPTFVDAPPADSSPVADSDAADAADSDARATPLVERPSDPTTDCAAFGESRALWTNAGGDDYGSKAVDVVLPTTRGEWRIADHWTGCEVFLFLNYHPDPIYTYPHAWLRSSAREWLDAAPMNAHFVFTSYALDDRDVAADMETLRAYVEAGLAGMEPRRAAHWRGHIHYVTRSAWFLDGDLGGLLDRHGPWAVGVDRFQLFREIGDFTDPDSDLGAVPLRAAGYELDYFNFESDRATSMAASGAQVLSALEDAPVAPDAPTWGEVLLPGPTTLGRMDELVLDIRADCDHPHWERCPAGSGPLTVSLCDVDDPETEEDEAATCDVEMGRVITPYGRPGRWLVDATPFLALLEAGPRRIAVEAEVAYARVGVSLRLRDAGREDQPRVVQALWNGGVWGASYDLIHPDQSVQVPPRTTRSQLVVVITGQGRDPDFDYCAELCDHQHEFFADGVSLGVVEHPGAGGDDGCADASEKGVVPNQYGDWAIGRGGWCPGHQVDPHVFEMSHHATSGEPLTLSYRTLHDGAPLEGESQARIMVRSWAVFWQ